MQHRTEHGHAGEQHEQRAASASETHGSLPTISDSAWANATGKWVDSWVRNSPIANDVGAWNRLNEVLPKLKELIEAELNAKARE